MPTWRVTKTTYDGSGNICCETEDITAQELEYRDISQKVTMLCFEKDGEYEKMINSDRVMEVERV